MRKYFKIVIALMLLSSIFLVGLPSANAAYNSKYLTEKEPVDYYSSLNMQATGESFRRSLSSIISKNYKQHSYDKNNEVLKETDPDPNKNGNIICFYTGQSLNSGWNKEHVWAKSHGFGTSSWAPYCDAHHLRPTLNSINSSRSNSDFGELDGISGVKSDSFGNRWTGNTFEPRDEVKGDVARIMFYMATRYGFEAPYNLMLVDDPHTSISKSGNGRFGNLQTLLKWHYEDPVSSSEIYRNNVIFDNWQHNRNPYIDHPEFVDLAWPNQYAQGGGTTEPDQTKVDNVVTLIALLPQNITLADKPQVMAAKQAYDALNFVEKERVYNYKNLTVAIAAINSLESQGGSDIPTPDVPEVSGNISVDFASHGVKSPTSYSDNQTFSIGDKSFYASAMGIFSGELRIGKNKVSSVDSKYGVSVSDGAVLEQMFDVTNALSLTVNISNHYGTLSKWHVLFKESSSTSYSLVASQSGGWASAITAHLNTPRNGRFVIVFEGTQPRAVLSKYEIATASVGPMLSEMEVSSSITARLENNQLVAAGLRFGGRYDKDLFANATHFGVLIVDSQTLGDLSIEECYEGGSFSELISFLDGLIPYLTIDFKDKKAIVDEQGKVRPDGEYYQFAIVVNDVIGHEKILLRAVVYAEIDGIVYFSQEIEASYYSTLLNYTNDESLSTEEKQVISKLLEIYQ